MAAPSGTKWGSIVNGTSSGRKGRLGIYTRVYDSLDTSKVNVDVQVWFWTIYSCKDTTNALYYNRGADITEATTNRGAVTINHTVSSGDGWNTANQTCVREETFTVSKNTSSKTYKVYAKLSGIDILDGVVYANTSYTVPALSSFTVAYNANGGSGAPANQTKYEGKTLTLSSTKPTRTGYNFLGWATSATGSVVYDPGDSITFDNWSTAPGVGGTSSNTYTLYAVWEAKTYTVKYDANGGSGAPSSQTKTYGKALTLSSTKPTRTNYTFQGWATSKTATTVKYAAGASYTTNAAVTLYAVWKLIYKKPRITNFSVKRCTSDGTLSDTGTYYLLKFNWACDKTVTSIVIERKLSSSSSWDDISPATLSASGTSGSVSVVRGGSLNIDSSYDIRVTVADGSEDANKTEKTAILGSTTYLVDLKSNGNGIAFGKTAELNGYMDVGYKSRFRDSVVLDKNTVIYALNTDSKTRQLVNFSNDTEFTVLGYGAYAAKDADGNSAPVGGTNIYGKEIDLYSRSDINLEGNTYVKGSQIAVNKVLWSGVYYMSDAQAANLNEAISSQANGIVLVWSLYEDGASSNANFNMFFIPKHFVSAHGGKGVSMGIWTATANAFASKYLYISDTSITGYANNNADSYTTSSGIKATPNNFVLRYVIGV